MKSNMLDYMYEGYGYDMDNQLLYTDVNKYDEALDTDGYSDGGMKTFASNDWNIVSHEDALEVEKANKYTELGQFTSENGANYTDLRQALCACGSNGTYAWAYNTSENATESVSDSSSTTTPQTSGNTSQGGENASTGNTESSGSTTSNETTTESGTTVDSGDTTNP